MCEKAGLSVYIALRIALLRSNSAEDAAFDGRGFDLEGSLI